MQQQPDLPVVEKQVTTKQDCPYTYKDCFSCHGDTFSREGQRIHYITDKCRNSYLQERMIKKSGLFGKDLNETFNTAKIDKHNRKLYDYLQNKWDHQQWTYIWSQENGTGKSYTANAIANMLISQGIQPVVKREVDMAAEIQKTFSDDTGDTEYALMGKWKEAPVLIIQDFGKYGCKSEWWPQHIFDIVDYRLVKGKTMVFTSNYNIEDQLAIERRFGENHGMAIYSRLNGMCDIWEMSGPDRRMGAVR